MAACFAVDRGLFKVAHTNPPLFLLPFMELCHQIVLSPQEITINTLYKVLYKVALLVRLRLIA